MALTITDQGGRILLNDQVDTSWAWVHLYMQPATITQQTTAADLVEVVAPWYAPLQVLNWSNAVTVGLAAIVYADPLVWTVGPIIVPLTVYGYWVSVGENGSLVWVEPAPGAGVPMMVEGAQCAIYPRLTLRTDPTPT